MKRCLTMVMAMLFVLTSLCVGVAAETIEVDMVAWEVADRILSAMGTGETTQENRWHKLLSEEYGIDVNYLWTASEGEYSEKLGLSLASGDLPDVIPFVDINQLHQAYDAGYLQDLSGVFDEYASDLLKEIYAYDENAGFNKVTFDGFVSAFPGVTPAYDNNPILYIRQDWLDNLGLAVPTNVAELVEVIRAFTEDDPDGNGENDTYGLSIGNNLSLAYGMVLGLATAFDAYPGCWMADDDGRVFYGSVEPEMKDFLALMNDMYEKGYIHPEFYTMNDGKLLEDITAGNVGVVYSMSWFPWIAQAGHNLDGAMWRSYPLVSQETNVIAPTPVLSGAHAYYAVRDGYEHPEVVVLMANAMVEQIWGESEEGAGYWFGTGDTEGIWQLSPVALLHPMNNFLIYQGFQKITETGSMEDVYGLSVSYYESCRKYREENDETNWACEYVMSDNPYSSNAANQTTFDAGAGVFRLSTWTQASSDYSDVLSQIINPVITKIITGELEMDAFDAAVEEWLANGGQAFVDEYQAWYNAL